MSTGSLRSTHLTSKLQGFGSTIFAEMTALATRTGAINLGQGFPDYDGPSEVLDAAIDAIRSGRNQYPPGPGVLELREAISEHQQRFWNLEYDPDGEILVTAGATEALAGALLGLLETGDEVVVLEPMYDSYQACIALAGAVARPVTLRPPEYGFDPEELRRAVTAKTRVILINSPHNPTGAVLDDEQLRTIAEIAIERDLIVVSDEVYEHIVFDGRSHESVLRYPELAARAFVISSFGKTYHCTGWKVGYCVAPAALTAEFRKVHQYNTFCTFAPAQWAFAEMIEQHPEHYDELGAFYQAKRDRFAAQLAGTKLKALPVPGGYFQLVDYSVVSDLDDLAFCRWLTIEKGVTAIPLSPFYETPPKGQRLARLCFAKNEATLDAAIERLAKL